MHNIGGCMGKKESEFVYEYLYAEDYSFEISEVKKDSSKTKNDEETRGYAVIDILGNEE